MTQEAPAYDWFTSGGAAFGAPGMPPRWTSSEKDAVGTAYSASSRVWFTVSHGILNEIYFPTIDRPQVRDLGFLITDGETFFHEEKRDLEHSFEYIDPDAPGVRIRSTDPQERYVLTKEIITDPHQSTLLVRVSLDGDESFLQRLKIYALLAPHLEVGGADNSGRIVSVSGKKILLAWKNNVSLAMACSCSFSRVSCGYVGTSDGWTDLHDNLQMDWQFDQALNGNIALMGEVEAATVREFTIGVSFGHGHHAAIAGVMQSLATGFAAHRDRFIAQWHRARFPEKLHSSTDHGRLLGISHNVLLAHEDKTFQGAFIASASIPWGQSKGDDDLGGYHLVWTRDMVQSATALLALGKRETPLRALVYLATAQRPDGSFSQNFWVNGTPYWSGMQLDEVALPIILAWRLWKLNALGEFNVFPFVERAAAYLMKHSPVTQQERWEENAGYSPSTLATVITGLICAGELMQSCEAEELAAFYAAFADWIEAHLEEWTVTNDGVLLPEVRRHYMRIAPPNPGERFFDPSAGEGKIRLSNQPPGKQTVFEAREIVDHGFLALVRFGIRSPHDPLVVDSLKVVDAVLKRDTPHGPCWRRYNHDGYGQQRDGGPYEGYGEGGSWPILTGERAHYELAAGHAVQPFISAIERFASTGGMLPEQLWDHEDIPAHGMYRGRPSGSAMPLAWAHAEYIQLLRSVQDGKVFDQVEPVELRYRTRKPVSIEICRRERLLTKIRPGQTLRLIECSRFQMVWTQNGWATHNTLDSSLLGSSIQYADLPIESDAKAVSFTLYWPDEDRWEGRNYDIPVTP